MRRNASSQRKTIIGEQASIVIPAVQDINDMKNRVNPTSNDNVLYHVKPTMEESIVRILPGELVFRVGNHRKRNVQASGSNMIECSSNTNGLYIPKNQVSLSIYQDVYKKNQPNLSPEVLADCERYALMENIRFIGVARTETSPNPSPEYAGMEKTILSVQIHGTTTIRHTGTKTLSPGDIVGLELMNESQVNDYRNQVRKESKPIHPDKIPLRLVPLDDMFDNVGSVVLGLLPHILRNQTPKIGDFDTTNGPIEMASAIGDLILFLEFTNSLPSGSHPNLSDFEKWKSANQNSFTPTIGSIMSNPGFLLIINNLVNAFQYLLKDYNRRKVGKVLSYAEAGDLVDILLGV